MSDTDAATELQLDTEEGTYTFLTRDGLVSTDAFRPAVLALLEHVLLRPDEDVLVVDGNCGVLGVVAGARAPEGETVVTETSARAAATCRENARRNGVTNVTVELTPDVGAVRDGFDRVVYAPKSYDPVDVVRQRLSDACSRLSPGGQCYVAGTKQGGITRYAGTLSDLLTDVERRTVEGACHVYRGERGQEFAPQRYSTDHEFRATVGEYTCRLLTTRGLFSWDHLDEGTATLLRAVSVPEGSRVLDCCCGYGAIAAFVGARTDCELWATDDDIVATTYAGRNTTRNGVTPQAVVTADCLDGVATETFDVVLSNPPTHAGSGVTEKLFAGIHEVLEDDGVAYLVANEIMGYDERLADGFGFATSVVASEGNYDVVRATPRR